MPTCWARCLGDCGNGWSREHTPSEGWFDTPAITTGGWGVPYKTIGMGSAGTKILCRRHNSGLSEVDQVGAQFSRAVRQVWPMVAGGTIRKTPLGFRFDGKKLERYFLKSTIGAFVKATTFMWRGGTEPDAPPRHLVEAAFGRSPLASPMGLYTIELPGHRPAQIGNFHPLLEAGKDGITGARIEAHMLTYIMWVNSDRAPNVTDDEFLVLADTSDLNKREMLKVDRDKVKITYHQAGNVWAAACGDVVAVFHIEW